LAKLDPLPHVRVRRQVARLVEILRRREFILGDLLPAALNMAEFLEMTPARPDFAEANGLGDVGVDGEMLFNGRPAKGLAQAAECENTALEH
jgi:hypothetical protein